MRTTAVIASLVFGLTLSNPAFGGGKATEMIRKGETTIRGKSTQAVMEMVIKRPSYTRTLKLRSWTHKDQNALVEILYPQKEEGVSSLRRTDKMWNYLPKVNQVVRVPTSLMLQSWMGSDFTNDDLMKASSILRDYSHKIIKKQKLGKHQTALIECTPKPNAPVVWGKIHYFSRLKDNLPVKQKYFDEDGKWVRTLTFSRFKKMDDRVIPTRVKVRTAEAPKNSTTVVYSKILYDRKIDQLIFDKDRLKQTSQEGKVISAGWSLVPLDKSKRFKKKANQRKRKLAKRSKK